MRLNPALNHPILPDKDCRFVGQGGGISPTQIDCRQNVIRGECSTCVEVRTNMAGPVSKAPTNTERQTKMDQSESFAFRRSAASCNPHSRRTALQLGLLGDLDDVKLVVGPSASALADRHRRKAAVVARHAQLCTAHLTAGQLALLERQPAVMPAVGCFAAQ